MRDITAETKQKARDMAREGRSWEEIAENLKVSKSSVKNWVKGRSLGPFGGRKNPSDVLFENSDDDDAASSYEEDPSFLSPPIIKRKYNKKKLKAPKYEQIEIPDRIAVKKTGKIAVIISDDANAVLDILKGL